MHLKEKEFIRWYDSDCRIRHIHKSYRGKILKFVIQLEVYTKKHWHPVVRYDTVHDFVHRDYLHVDGRINKTPVFIDDYNKALNFAQEDLKANWKLYRKQFLEEVK